MKEKCLLIVKPDVANNNEFSSELLSILDSNDIYVVKSKTMTASRDLLSQHYAHLADKPFFNDIVEYMTSDTIKVMIVEGENAISILREQIGATNPNDAAPHTLRAKYGKVTETAIYNCIHCSDSVDSATKEINIWWENE